MTKKGRVTFWLEKLWLEMLEKGRVTLWLEMLEKGRVHLWLEILWLEILWLKKVALTNN